MVRPGIRTDEIDEAVHQMCIDKGVYPSPLNYYHFPKSVCTSVNEIICHGIPDARELQDGDIVNIDVTVYWCADPSDPDSPGFHGDLNETYPVGKVEPQYKVLIKTAYEAMMSAIDVAAPGVLNRDFGPIISDVVGEQGFDFCRKYTGHGIGTLFHCAPTIPHYKRNKGVGVCKPGNIFTIEPMINMGTWEDETWPDNWTACTKDGKRSAQFEHTILITEKGHEILTSRTENSVPFWWEEEGVPLTMHKDILAEREAKRQKSSSNWEQQMETKRWTQNPILSMGKQK